MVVLVTGANGQLGQSLQFVAKNYPDVNFVFCDSATLNITDLDNCESIFEKHKPNFCINTAAYTAVDKAETEIEKAYLINVVGARNLAETCKKFDSVLIHISTDFVFDGTSKIPYLETDSTNPTGVYGQTKLDGEKVIQETFDDYFIIRTSWVYSQFGNNFMKTMLRLAADRDSLSVVNDQVGTPTNAVDLANVLVKLVISDKTIVNSLASQETTHNPQPTTHNLQPNFGIYNFSNQGQCSWYEFAAEIFHQNNVKIDLKPIPSSQFPTPAKRPSFSVLDKSKIKNLLEIKIKTWQESLKTVVFSVITENKP